MPEDYTAQLVNGWIYQVRPEHYGYYLDLWHPKGRQYRHPKAFEQYEKAVAFAKTLIALAHCESNRVTTSNNSPSFDLMMRQLARIECDDCIYKEWHIKSYEDSDNDWDIYAIDPLTGKAEISLTQQADLQAAIVQVQAQIDEIEAERQC